MTSERVIVHDHWRLGLAVARVAIAVGLVAAELYPIWFPLTTTSMVYLAYVVYGLAAIWWQKRDNGASDLLRLMADMIVLLICIGDFADRSVWMPAIFYLFTLTAASILHRLREIAMVAAITTVFSILISRGSPINVVPIVLVGGAVAVIAGWQRKELDARLSTAAKQTVLFRTEAENARELERQRIAADLHDGPLQSFISFQMRLEVIKKLLKRDQAAAVDDMTQLQDICRKQTTDMRAFVRSMRMSADGATPATSVRQIADDFQKSSGIQLTWNVSDALSGLEPEISHEVLQIIREALHNAQKHSRAAKVSLSAEKSDRALNISVEDDGSGFPFGGTYNLDELELMRMGPESIKRRVRTLSGELIVESNPGRGASLKIRVPL